MDFDKDVTSIQRHKEIFEKSFNYDFIKDMNGTMIYGDFERNFIMMYGNNKKIVGKDCEIIKVNIDDISEFFYKDDFDLFISRVKCGIKESFIEVRNLKDKLLYLKTNLVIKKNNKNEVISFSGYLLDCTSEKLLEFELESLKNYDVLTGFNNKKNFEVIVNKELIKHRNKENRGAFIVMDIDNFKFINDSYGHDIGDLLIKNISKYIRSINKNGELCRFGGDEFIAFLPNIKSLEEIHNYIDIIKYKLNKGYDILNNKIKTTASFGISLFPDDSQTYDGLLKKADSAKFKAKINGKNEAKMFNDKILEEVNRLYSIQKGIREAIENNEMYVVFQPKVKLSNNEVDGFEALIRWNSKKIGEVSPYEFIKIAEDTKTIIEIGEFVLREVFKKVKYLLENNYDNFKIAVNLSEIQLRESDIVSYFLSLLEEFKIEPKYIEFEITESMFMKSVSRNIEVLMKLKDLGSSIALDDFGTGYSSLNYLTKLPIDVLKIDRSFIVDMDNNEKSKYIVENIIELSHKLNISVVAEGVEEEKQVNYLKSINCDTVQGYYYSKPQEFEKVINMLNKKGM